jgi:hypothetical protein
MRPPVFLEGHLVGRGPGLHLVEGHTRIGLLAGLVDAGILGPDSVHCAWVGAGAAPPVCR